MRLIDAEKYVCINGQYQEDAPDNSKYCVRFPKFYSPRVFFSNDTYDLVNQVYEFANSEYGQSLWNLVKDQYISDEEIVMEEEYE